MERKKARKRRRGRSAAEEITRKGLRIFNKRDQIKSLAGTGGMWHPNPKRVSGAVCIIEVVDKIA